MEQAGNLHEPACRASRLRIVEAAAVVLMLAAFLVMAGMHIDDVGYSTDDVRFVFCPPTTEIVRVEQIEGTWRNIFIGETPFLAGVFGADSPLRWKDTAPILSLELGGTRIPLMVREVVGGAAVWPTLILTAPWPPSLAAIRYSRILLLALFMFLTYLVMRRLIGVAAGLVWLALCAASIHGVPGGLSLHYSVGLAVFAGAVLAALPRPEKPARPLLVGLLLGILLFIHPLKAILPITFVAAAIACGIGRRLRPLIDCRLFLGIACGLLPSFGVGFIQMLGWLRHAWAPLDPLQQMSFLKDNTFNAFRWFVAPEWWIGIFTETTATVITPWTVLIFVLPVTFVVLEGREIGNRRNLSIGFLLVVLAGMILCSALAFQPAGVYYQLIDLTFAVMTALTTLIAVRISQRAAERLRGPTAAILVPLCTVLVIASGHQSWRMLQALRTVNEIEVFQESEFRELAEYLETARVYPITLGDSLLGIVEYYTAGRVRPEHAALMFGEMPEDDPQTADLMRSLIQANRDRAFVLVERKPFFLPSYEQAFYRAVAESGGEIDIIRRFGPEDQRTFTLCRVHFPAATQASPTPR